MSYLVTTYEPDAVFYRARLASEGACYHPVEMGAPPASACTVDGRINARGIRCLYLANTAETTLHEIRAGGFDKACIGSFYPNRKTSVIDLRKIKDISPFTPGIDDIQSLALNKGYFEQLDEYMSRRSGRGEGSLDYIPTQYIADFIKNGMSSDCYDGVVYRSTMNEAGDCYNLAIFDPAAFECRSVTLFEAKVAYKLEPVRTVASFDSWCLP